MTADAPVVTFCQNWNSGSPEQKVKFLLGPEEKVLANLKSKGMPDGNIALFKICFEENITKLRDKLDSDCRVEDALTRYFGHQVDTSSQEYDHMTEYLNMCAVPEGQET